MFRNKLGMMFVAGVATLALPAFAQSEESVVSKQDISVQAFGSFLKSTTRNGIENKSDNSAGVLGTYRYFFTDHQGVEADYGFTQAYQYYGLPGSLNGIKTYSNEISGAYVFRMPMKKITPFVLAGAGALVFDPHNFAGASTQTRATGVYGAGADINLSHHIFVRGEYRGLIYNSPTYGTAALAGADRVTHRAEPSVGFGYRF